MSVSETDLEPAERHVAGAEHLLDAQTIVLQALISSNEDTLLADGLWHILRRSLTGTRIHLQSVKTSIPTAKVHVV